MTRLFIDTEFVEDGSTIDLISIGVVREDGVVYYAESSDADLDRANDWVKANVLPHLWHKPEHTKTREQIAADLVEFAGDSPEWWAYMGAYDWVVLCQLYGPMVDKPASWPHYVRDAAMLADQVGFDPDSLPTGDDEHNALADAYWTRRLWRRCMDAPEPIS